MPNLLAQRICLWLFLLSFLSISVDDLKALDDKKEAELRKLIAEIDPDADVRQKSGTIIVEKNSHPVLVNSPQKKGPPKQVIQDRPKKDGYIIEFSARRGKYNATWALGKILI